MTLGALLVVEDESRLLRMLADALGEAGYWVIEAADGARALSTLRHGSPSFAGLITDIKLGSTVDGWQLARETRGLSPDIGVVYTSGTESHRWSYHGVPGSVMIAKPFTATRAIVTITTLLDKPSRRRFANDLS